MASDPRRFGRVALTEGGAFERLSGGVRHATEAAEGLAQRLNSADMVKLTAALRVCIEASTEISVRRDDLRWFSVTPAFEKLLQKAQQMHMQAMQMGGSPVPPRHWLVLAGGFRSLGVEVTRMWADAERGAVQGAPRLS